jgi:trigger factor
MSTKKVVNIYFRLVGYMISGAETIRELSRDKFRVEVEITVPFEKITILREEEIAYIRTNGKFDGFRKGHVPSKFIMDNYGQRVKAEAANKAISSRIDEYVKQENLKLATSPEIDLKTKFEDDTNLVVNAIFNLMPDVEEFDLSRLNITIPRVKLVQDDYDSALNAILEQNSSSQVKEGDAKEGDIVVINSIGRIDGVAFDGGKLDKHPLQLGSGSFIPGFEDQLIGSNNKDKKHVMVKVKFPENYGSADLQGKDAEFETEVVEVRENVKAELTDDLAQKVGAQNLEDLKAKTTEKTIQYYEKLSKDSTREKIFDALSKALAFDVPDALTQPIEEKLFATARERNERGSEFNRKTDEELLAQSKESATQQMRLRLFLSNIAEVNNLKFEDQDIFSFILEEAANSGRHPMEIMNFYRSNPQTLDGLKNYILETKVLNFIISSAKVSDLEIDRKDFDDKSLSRSLSDLVIVEISAQK